MTLIKKIAERPLALHRLLQISFLPVLLALSFQAFSQIFPIQSSTQLVPPYSVYLSDYATPGNEKLRVILVQRDLTQPSYQFRLVMQVEWNGKVIMRTSRAYNPAPISLDPGVPTIISGAELFPYLDSRNIDFVGYSREQYERTKALPEGSYRISFTAYDYRRQDVQVSNEGSNFYYLSKNEPPLINLPVCGAKVPVRQPQQVIFSWLPRNTSSPASAGETQYEFSLYEIRPEGRNPNDVVLSSQPVFRTTMDYTQLVYGPAEPQLIENMRYAWRVRAIDTQGRDAFRNNGYSEVCTFTYGGVDPAFIVGGIEGLQAEGESERSARIWWELGNFDSYRIYYKKSGQGHEWFTSDLLAKDLDPAKEEGELKLFDLEPDTEYETRAQAKKMGTPGPYTEIIKFRTLPVRVAHCGDPALLPEGGPGEPFREAIKGMTIGVDGMEMALLEVVHLGDGYYQGLGRVSVDYLGEAAFTASFDRIFINTDRQVVLGRIDFVTNGVAVMAEEQLAVQKDREQERIKEANREKWKETEFYGKIFLFDNIAIEDVTLNGPNLNVTDSEGNIHPNTEVAAILTSNPEKAIVIEDKNGDQWVVEKDGDGAKVTKVEGGGLGSTGGSGTPQLATEREEELLLAVLDEFEEAMTAWLEIHGKGPLTLDEMRLLQELPEGIPADEDLVNYMVSSSLNAARENKQELIQKIKEENSGFTELASKINDDGAYNGLSEAEQTTIKQIIAGAFTDWSLTKYFEDALAYFGPYKVCIQKGLEKGKETFWKYISLGAAYNAGFVETGLCLTSAEMCGSSEYWSKFSCGAANALIQEIDIVGMADGVVYLGEAALKNAFECIMDGGIVGMSLTEGNVDGVLYAALKCGIGIDVKPEELKGIFISVKKYAVENWDDPYLHGQATVAVLTIVVPVTKLSKLSKVRLLDKLKKGKLASKIDELEDISKAADEGGIAKAKEVLDEKIAKAGESNLVARVQAKLSLYPKVPDLRTGKNIILPHVEKIVPKIDRVKWDLKARGEFIKEWYDRGYETPVGGWDKYDIHHIKPREFGGTNDFWNLVPVERNTHQKEFNKFWREFAEL